MAALSARLFPRHGHRRDGGAIGCVAAASAVTSGRLVGRAVVGDDDLGGDAFDAGHREEALEQAAESSLAVPGRDDDGEAGPHQRAAAPPLLR